MSLKSEESDKKFRDWKAELDKRCVEHLAKHPEGPKPVKPKSEVSTNGKTVVEVVQRDMAQWAVLRNGILMIIVSGGDAHQRATAYANKLLNGF